MTSRTTSRRHGWIQTPRHSQHPAQPGANTISVSRPFKKLLPQLETKPLPASVKVTTSPI